MTRDEVITEHRRLSECWAGRCGQPKNAAKHLARIEELTNGADLTDHEKAGNDIGMMYETIQETN